MEGLALKFQVSLFHVQQLDLKNQHGTAGDSWWSALVAITQVRWNRQPTRAADFHTRNALVPPCDDCPCAQRETERLVAIPRTIKFGAVGQGADVMDGNLLAHHRFGAVAQHQVFILQARGSCHRRSWPLRADTRITTAASWPGQEEDNSSDDDYGSRDDSPRRRLH